MASLPSLPSLPLDPAPARLFGLAPAGGLLSAVLKGAAGLLGIHRSWLTLLMVGIVAAGIWYAYASQRARADRLQAWASATCLATGVRFDQAALPGQPKARRQPPGALCQAEVVALALYRQQAATAAAATLARAQQARETKTARDTVLATTQARDARAAQQAMEAANAKVQADRVDADWIDALNRTAGL